MPEKILKTCPICGSRTKKINDLFVCQSENYECGAGWKMRNGKMYSPTIHNQKSRKAAKECLEFLFATLGSKGGLTC